ncbi:MAG: hypothetical protein U0V70_06445 [Terriglobia bacterium]
MEKTLLSVLIVLGILFLCLGLGELVRSRRKSREFWLLGLGVRSRLGAGGMIVLSVAFFALAYGFYKTEALHHFLRSVGTSKSPEMDQYTQGLERSRVELETLKGRIDVLEKEKEDCQNIVRRQGQGLADKNDLTAEMKVSLGLRQKEITQLNKNLGETRQKLETLQQDYEKLRRDDEQTKGKLQDLDAKVADIQNEKVALQQKLDNGAKAADSEVKRLKEENLKSRNLVKDQERRTDLLRQGLQLHERNDWTLDQEVQRLSALITSQMDVSSPRQTDIARSIQRIQQIVREGQVVTKQTKAADAKMPEPAKDKPDPGTGKKN